MPVTGIHALFYTSEPERMRAVFRDVFALDNVDAGDGWLIFELPPAELGIHPADEPRHEVTFMCDDITRTVAELRARDIEIKGDVQDEGFGLTAIMVLPGAVDVMLYEPRHPTAI